MNFWKNMWAPIRGWFGGRYTSGSQITGPAGYDVPSSVAVSEDTALQVSAVWACVRLISQTVASLPVIVYRKTETGRVVDTSHWLAKLMAGQPNQYQTRYEFWEHQVANLALHGNFYCRKVELAGQIRALLPLGPLRVDTKLVDGKVVHLYSTDGGVVALASDSVWHARMNADLIVGRSPLQFGRNIIGVAQSTEQVVSKIYANGGKPSGVLSLDKLLTPEQRQQVRESFSSLTTGTDERLLVLELGAKFEAVSLSPGDIELLASRKYNVDDIARWFGVPSVLINQNEGSTTLGSSTGEIIAAFYKLNLRPYLEAIENSISVHLLSDEERGQYEVEFDFEGLLRADQKTRYDGYRLAIGSGLITPNEARRQEWLPDIAGGDQLFMQSAMLPIDKLGTVKPTAQPTTPPEGAS